MVRVWVKGKLRDSIVTHGPYLKASEIIKHCIKPVYFSYRRCIKVSLITPAIIQQMCLQRSIKHLYGNNCPQNVTNKAAAFYIPEQATVMLTQLKLRKINVPPNTLQVISGTGFYGSNDSTNSVR